MLKNRIFTVIALAALSLLAAWPLLRYGPPLQAEAITDGPNHLYRFALLYWHVQHGDFYPRWFSDLHYGFGAPVLNFYAPLSYYLLLGLRLLIPSFPTAFLWGFVLAIATAVWGMYFWVRDQFASPLAGLVGAAAYALTPYTYFSILDRAAYPEMWGLALAPWLFWLALRLIRHPSYGTRLALTVLCSSLILTHSLSTLLFTPILLTYSLITWLQIRNNIGWQALMWMSISLVHAVCIAAFFVLPFLLESQFVQLQRTGLYDYTANFGSASDLFSPPVPFDPRHVANVRPISVPWPQLALALAALATTVIWRKHRIALPTVSIHSLLAALLIFMNLRQSLPLWSLLPFASLIQFPFRLLGPAMLLMAWMAGAFIVQLPAPSIQRPFALAAIASFFFFSLTWTYHAPFDRFPDDIRPADIIRDEIAHPSRLGTTNLQEFLPRWVSELPPSDTILPRFADNPIPSRLAALPPDITRYAVRNSLNSEELAYTASSAFAATYNIFYFPGWTATLDGNPIPIRISQPHGLILLDLPAGRHRLNLALQPTTPKIVGNVAALIALLALFIRLPSTGTLAGQSPTAPGLPASGAALIIALLALRIGVLDRIETPFFRVGLDSLTSRLSVDFDDQIRLVGVDLPRGASFTSGAALHIDLYWEPITSLARDYHTAVQLVDAHGNRFGLSDHERPGGVPTSQWRIGQYARDQHQLLSLAGAPPGQYHVRVSVYAGAPLNIRSADGAPTGIEYDLGAVTLMRGQPQPPGPLRLIAADVAADVVSVGDQLPFTILWSSGNSPTPGLAASINFLNDSGLSFFSATFPPAGPDYTSDQWAPNELILYPHSLDIPPDLPPGPAHLSLTFIRPDGSPASVPFDLGAVTIILPDRSFVIPPMSHPVHHDFGAAIRLLGYDLAPDSITLYWQSLQPVTTRLTVFVHNFDGASNFTGGHDAAPARPTTSWFPGEVVTDVHPLIPDDYFEVGLYDPVTGERFGDTFSTRP